MRTLVTAKVVVDGYWPTSKEIENRNIVIEELSDRNMGKFIEAGSKPRSMHFTYEVHDVSKAKSMISKAMFNHLPGWQYSIEAQELSLANKFQAANDVGKRAAHRQIKRQQGFGMGM